MNFKPALSKILIKRVPAVQTYGGLVLEERSNDSEGTVVALGESRRLRTHTGEITVDFYVKVGDHVVFNASSSFPITIEGSDAKDQYVLIEEESVVGFKNLT